LAKKDFSQREEKVAPDEGNEEELKEEASDVESLKKALEEEKEKAEKYLANWQRAQADFINYKRRSEHERAEAANYSNSTLIMSLLPVLDDFERALASVREELAESSWVDGIKHIYRKLKAVLEAQGVSVIEAEGKDFDPHFHEAVMAVEGEEGKVVEEIQKGYRLLDRVIRPTQVKVGKGIANK